MGRIDLHTHTIYSDGKFHPKEIISISKNIKNINLLAITDHNTFEHAGQTKYWADYFGMKTIIGTEVSTKWNGHDIHLLGYYNLNTDFEDEHFCVLKTLFISLYQSKQKQIKAILDNLSNDYDVSYDEFLEYANGFQYQNYNRVHIAQYLTSKQIINTVEKAFQTILDKKSKYYVDSDYAIDFFIALKAIIVSTGGFVSIAHPSQCEMTVSEWQNLFNGIKNITDKIGIELYHPDNDKEFTNEFREFCEEEMTQLDLKIIYTAGSDTHGDLLSIDKNISYQMNGDEETIYDSDVNKLYQFITECGLI